MPFEDRQGRVCGFLNIEETEGSGTFCRRYFVLDHINGKLMYYMDSPANLPEAWRSPVGEIFVHSISKVSDGTNQRVKVQFCFVIIVAGRQYFLQAESPQGQQDWIQAIKNASKITVPKKCPKSSQHEWHAGGVEEGGYVTEIAGGVVCKMPIQATEGDSESGSEDESRSSSSGTPPSSTGRTGDGREGSRSSYHQPLKPIKAGFCVKQGAVRKNWKRRYFLLHDRGLSYFKTIHDKQPLRTILKEDILQAHQAPEGSHVNRDNLFEVITAKRTFYIQCDTPADVRDWVVALRSLLATTFSQARMTPQNLQDFSGDTREKPAQKVWL